jgi:hypothetical protein
LQKRANDIGPSVGNMVWTSFTLKATAV